MSESATKSIDNIERMNNAKNAFIAGCLDSWAVIIEENPELIPTVIKDMKELAHLHRGPDPFLAVDRHMTARLLDEAVDHGKPQPRAAAHPLGGEERVERLFDHIARHSAPGIGHRDHDIVSRRPKGPPT